MHLILWGGFCFVRIPFGRMFKFQFLAQFPVDHLPHPVMSCLAVFCTNLLHSLIIWLIVSSLLPYNMHLLFCCFLSIFALTKSLWRRFVLLLKEIQFLPWDFPCIAMSRFSRVQSHVCLSKYPYSCFSTLIYFLVFVVFYLYLFCRCCHWLLWLIFLWSS